MTLTAGTSTARPVRSRRALVAGLLVAAAGAAVWWALVLRWAPCWGALDPALCEVRQDHRYDSFLPTDPWAPVPGVTQLEGVAFLLLAAGLGIGLTGRVVRRAVRALRWALLAAVVLIGVLNVVSGVTAGPVPLAGAVHVGWLFGSLFALVVAVTILVTGVPDRLTWACAAVLAVLSFHHSVAEVLLTGIGPYDTAPWTGWVSGSLYVALGVWIVVLGGRARS